MPPIKTPITQHQSPSLATHRNHHRENRSHQTHKPITDINPQKIITRELTDEIFGVWKLDGDDSGETPTIKHH
jgi:hypothetical protein